MTVDISRYRGDLILELESPSGKSVKLDSSDDGTDDISGTYDVDAEPLTGFVGESLAGNWTAGNRYL